MRIGIYTPYLDSFGGGERYMLTIAEILSEHHRVELLLNERHLSIGPDTLISSLSKRLNLKLDKVNLTRIPMGRGLSFVKRLFFLHKYDLIISLTDGSVFYSTAKQNIIHFQVPFKNSVTQSLWGKIKLSSWNLAICNSQFTQRYIKKEWPIKTAVLYPPVDVEKIKPGKKEKIILSVGRFTSFSKSKKHEDMIKAFRQLSVKKEASGWNLYLAGSVEGDESYLDELKELAEGLSVNFYPNMPFSDLVDLYGKASIYWHAAGFGEEDPAKMEHFGITTVEAMAGGCVPVVINKGGQPEIVEDQKSGFLWNDTNELVNYSVKLIGDQGLMDSYSKEAIKRSKLFAKDYFNKELLDLIHSLEK